MAKCKKCGLEIDWKKSGGRWCCFNSGTEVEHWDACKTAEWKKVAALGVRFEAEKGSGYLLDGRRHYDIQTSGWHTGSLYKPSGDCTECCLPWEVCDWPCPDATPTLA